MRHKELNEMSEAEIEALSTKQLLSRLRNLLQSEESPLLSDHSGEPCRGRRKNQIQGHRRMAKGL
jgi:hypothetical protein